MPMTRRRLSLTLFATGLAALSWTIAGCRNHQYARVIQPGEKEMIGSHKAGAETFRPLVEDATTKLLARNSQPEAFPASYNVETLPLPPKRICFIGVENH